MMADIPYVPKNDVSIIAIGNTLEAITIRALLESFNYNIAVHWVGSRKELVKIFRGEIRTDTIAIISCHGVEEGIVIPDEPILTAGEIGSVARLDDKILINLGCLTGADAFVAAFKAAGVRHYVAPIDYPEAKAAIAFVSNLFLLLASGVEIADAAHRAANFDAEMQQFRLLI